ncbi:hypothetical protein DFO58_3302 [Arthrobacter sp. AG1021]|uniref:hypothetical protein n=1 Tax=Arthrobacter sp. AG1021 TaxID=2183908 RepID=UPI000EAE3EE9|nr:hypothetical protein [Arthrobacter sp. AG1021]RKS16745.1 hypothetical protein DFO58_3302 [Arthrobacter sp. AG1021]
MTDALHQVMVTAHVPTGATTPAPDGTPSKTRTRIDWGPCNFQPASSTEDRAGKHTVTGEYFISGPLNPRITAGSIITVAGNPYKVKAEPKHFASGILDHTELNLIDQKG